MNLRQRQKCRLLQPSWLTPETLESVREEEKEAQYFTKLPAKNMFVVAKILLDVALVDLTQADRVKSLVKDIWDVRQAKLRKSVDAFVRSGLQHAKLDHLELMELNAVRPMLPEAIDHLGRLEAATAGVTARSASHQRMAGNSSMSAAGDRSHNATMY